MLSDPLAAIRLFARPSLSTLSACVLASGCLSLAAPPAAAAAEAQFNPPKHFYLALGDSAAFGFQLGKFQQEIATNSYSPASFNTGYVDDFAAKMRAIRPQLQVVNYSCPGETTATLIFGDCPFHNPSRPLPLHNDYPITTSQLDAALAFLREHDGDVSPITINIGGNDASPSSEVVLLTVYNPFIRGPGWRPPTLAGGGKPTTAQSSECGTLGLTQRHPPGKRLQGTHIQN